MNQKALEAPQNCNLIRFSLEETGTCQEKHNYFENQTLSEHS